MAMKTPGGGTRSGSSTRTAIDTKIKGHPDRIRCNAARSSTIDSSRTRGTVPLGQNDVHESRKSSSHGRISDSIVTCRDG
ncbi:hypothetical protein VTO42DRAFT_1221 [Malbranchea cinnamomea]